MPHLSCEVAMEQLGDLGAGSRGGRFSSTPCPASRAKRPPLLRKGAAKRRLLWREFARNLMAPPGPVCRWPEPRHSNRSPSLDRVLAFKVRTAGAGPNAAASAEGGRRRERRGERPRRVW